MGRFGCNSGRGVPGSLEVTKDGRLQLVVNSGLEGGGDDRLSIVDDGTWRCRRRCRLGRRRRRKHARGRCQSIHHQTLPVLGNLPHFELQGRELVHLDPQVIHHALHAGAPFVEHPGGGLQRVEVGGRRGCSGVELALKTIEPLVLDNETLVELLEQLLRLRTHGSAAALQAGEVLVVSDGGGIQIDRTHHKLRTLDWNYRILNTSCSSQTWIEVRPTRSGGFQATDGIQRI